MATRTIDPAVLEAARLEAERRQISLDQLVADYLAGSTRQAPTDRGNEALIRLMYENRLGNVDRPMTRAEIYAERSWPRS